MKYLQASALSLLLLLPSFSFTGCQNTGTGEPSNFEKWTCITAQSAYLAYLSIQNANENPSPEEIALAIGAGSFLQQACGWSAPTPDGTRAEPPQKDANGVPVIVPPGSSPKRARHSSGDWK